MAESSPKIQLRPWTSLPRPFLLAVALVFCAATTVYAFNWMYYSGRPTHPVELGFNRARDTFFDPATSSLHVYNVAPASPAERAGLRPGDEIIGVNGQVLTSYTLFDRVWSRSHPGDPVEVTVRRSGDPQPVTLHAIFRASSNDLPEGPARASARQIQRLFPFFFVLVGFAVLFLRLDNSRAWLLAVLFACFVGAPDLNNPLFLSDFLRAFTSAYHCIFAAFLSALLYVFFALFPERSPLERRAPWLKWVAIAVCALQIPPGLSDGNHRWPQFVEKLIGETASGHLSAGFSHGFIALGLLSLIWNCYSVEVAPEARRKSRVLLAGTLLGVLPVVVERFFIDFYGYRPPFWIDVSFSLLVLLYPLSFAYAVVKYRVLEIPVLLRRSVRFVLVQRGYFLLLVSGALVAILLFARFFSGYFAQNSQYGMALSAVFGVALVWVSGPIVKRGTDSIDRAFFRSSYDARVILQNLAEKTRTVTNRHELARLLELHIAGALHPKSLACYLDAGGGNLVAESQTPPPESAATSSALPRPEFPFRFGAVFVLRQVDTIPATTPLLVELAGHGKAWDVPPPVPVEAGNSSALVPECMVPILARNGELIGLLVLGPRLSEEPYSGEDKRLLDSVASHSAIALENICMAEQIANRLEADRRAAHEMQIARDVQSRLFPQATPPLTTLEYTGSCIQARQVGGDYYDFLDLGSSNRLDRGATHTLPAAAWHLAFVLADISGKGIAGALLMANLQANLRSRYALALDDLPRLLKSVNQLFYENTPDDRYATLFFAVYDDHSRELEYANCGHNAPLLFRASGSLERLAPTSTVIGLFPEWKCVTQRVTLTPGDVLVIYTDGVTEANDAHGNEFGEARLVKTVEERLLSPPSEILTAIQQAVQSFSAGEQSDDLTLVVARAR